MSADLLEALKHPKVFFPAQCECGHIFMEHFCVPESWPQYADGFRGFSYCGFCGNRRFVKEAA